MQVTSAASTADRLMATAKAHGISGTACVDDMVSISHDGRDYLVLCGEQSVSICGLTPAQAVLAIVGVEGCQLSMSGTARCDAPCRRMGGAS